MGSKRQDNIGELDRRIVIEKNSPSVANDGQRITSWTTLATVWARWSPVGVASSGSEVEQSDEIRGIHRGVFRIRNRSGINNMCRILYNSVRWEVVGVREDGRNNYMLIDVETRKLFT